MNIREALLRMRMHVVERLKGGPRSLSELIHTSGHPCNAAAEVEQFVAHVIDPLVKDGYIRQTDVPQEPRHDGGLEHPALLTWYSLA